LSNMIGCVQPTVFPGETLVLLSARSFFSRRKLLENSVSESRHFDATTPTIIRWQGRARQPKDALFEMVGGICVSRSRFAFLSNLVSHDTPIDCLQWRLKVVQFCLTELTTKARTTEPGRIVSSGGVLRPRCC
jgi:hypothetical protein